MAKARFLYLCVILIFPSLLLAQQETSSVSASVYDIAFDSALNKLSKPQLAIYTGRAYYPYFIKEVPRYAVTSATSAGNRAGEHPFFISDDFRFEKIEFDGVAYPSIELAYDICRSEVVVLNPKRKAIVLPEGRVKSFTYSGHKFRALTGITDLKSDFYDILYWSDSASLCVKRRKNQSELWRTISDYYIIRDTQAYPISALTTKSVGVKNTVLRILADKNEQVRDYIRQNRLKFSKSKKEQSLLKVVEYYASLKNK